MPIAKWPSSMYSGSDWIAPPVRAQSQLTESASPSIIAEGPGMRRRNQHQAARVAPIVQTTDAARAATADTPVTLQIAASRIG